MAKPNCWNATSFLEACHGLSVRLPLERLAYIYDRGGMVDQERAIQDYTFNALMSQRGRDACSTSRR